MLRRLAMEVHDKFKWFWNYAKVAVPITVGHHGPSTRTTAFSIVLTDSFFDMKQDKVSAQQPSVVDSTIFDNDTDVQQQETWSAGGTASTAYTVTLTQGVQTNESSSANLQVPTPIGTFGFSGGEQVTTSLGASSSRTDSFQKSWQKSTTIFVPAHKRIVATMTLTPTHHQIPFKARAQVRGSVSALGGELWTYDIGWLFAKHPAADGSDPAFGFDIKVIDDQTISVGIEGVFETDTGENLLINPVQSDIPH